MRYTVEEKRKMDKILAAFADYVSGHYYFDIVYTPKKGYIKVFTEDALLSEVIENSEELLDCLYQEIDGDVRDLHLAGKHYNEFLFPVEIEETRRRAEEILNKLDEEKEYCLERLNLYLEHVSD